MNANHVLEALQTIDSHGTPRGRHSRGYDLLHQGRRYPPKYAMALAIGAATGTFPTSESFGGGAETHGVLERLGFTVVEKGKAVRREGLRLGVVSLRTGTVLEETKALRAAFSLARSEHQGPLILLFSGASTHWSKDPTEFLRLARKHEVSALAELDFPVGARYVAYEAGSQEFLPNRMRQRFGGGAEADKHPELVDAVLAECEPGGERRVELAGLHLGVIICGENNLLQSRQAKGNACEGIRRHPGRALLPGVDVVLNGGHTVMGNWSKLNQRFAWISRNKRLFAYATNNNKRSWGATIRVFYDGERIADGHGASAGAPGAPFGVRYLAGSGVRIVVLDGFAGRQRSATG